MLKTLLSSDWAEKLGYEFEKEYFLNLDKFLISAYENYTIYPDKNHIFEALNITSYENTKVVILGQDPYYGENQAHGLSFSVPDKMKLPPSLRNIYKELSDDLNINRTSGNLLDWAKQGVLLLNTVLTVEQGKPGSHRNKGWEEFTEAIIKLLDSHERPIVFILWGNDAMKKEKLIKNKNHLIIKGPHPSPLSSYRGFFGSKPFSKTNEFIVKNNMNPILW